MPLLDSVDKIVTVYLAGLCARGFTYKGRLYEPRPLYVSPLLLRGYTCPTQCGGCCPRFSLDYLPSERTPYALEARKVVIDGVAASVLSDRQLDHSDHFCRNLDKGSGRCAIHGRRPFSCDFELIRVLFYPERVVLTQKLFGRGWAMQRVDGGRGARCEMLPADPETVGEVIRKLKRLGTWANWLGVRTRIDPIISWAERMPGDALFLEPKTMRG